MCVIISTFQKTKNSIVQQAIIKQVLSLSRIHDDGVGVIAFNDTGQNYFHQQSFNITKETLKQIFQKYSFVNIHLRLSNSGIVKKSNIHFWKEGNWLLAHNGNVNKLKSDKRGERCDSYLLFQLLLKQRLITQGGKIKYQGIKKLLDSLNFWGRLELINLKTKKIYFFGDFKGYILEDDNLVFSTQTLSFNSQISLFGMPIEIENSLHAKTLEIEGINYFNLKNNTFKAIDGSLYVYTGCGDYNGYGTFKKYSKAHDNGRFLTTPYDE